MQKKIKIFIHKIKIFLDKLQIFIFIHNITFSLFKNLGIERIKKSFSLFLLGVTLGYILIKCGVDLSEIFGPVQETKEAPNFIEPATVSPVEIGEEVELEVELTETQVLEEPLEEKVKRREEEISGKSGDEVSLSPPSGSSFSVGGFPKKRVNIQKVPQNPPSRGWSFKRKPANSRRGENLSTLKRTPGHSRTGENLRGSKIETLNVKDVELTSPKKESLLFKEDVHNEKREKLIEELRLTSSSDLIEAENKVLKVKKKATEEITAYWNKLEANKSKLAQVEKDAEEERKQWEVERSASETALALAGMDADLVEMHTDLAEMHADQINQLIVENSSLALAQKNAEENVHKWTLEKESSENQLLAATRQAKEATDAFNKLRLQKESLEKKSVDATKEATDAFNKLRLQKESLEKKSVDATKEAFNKLRLQKESLEKKSVDATKEATDAFNKLRLQKESLEKKSVDATKEATKLKKLNEEMALQQAKSQYEFLQYQRGAFLTCQESLDSNNAFWKTLLQRQGIDVSSLAKEAAKLTQEISEKEKAGEKKKN